MGVSKSEQARLDRLAAAGREAVEGTLTESVQVSHEQLALEAQLKQEDEEAEAALVPPEDVSQEDVPVTGPVTGFIASDDPASDPDGEDFEREDDLSDPAGDVLEETTAEPARLVAEEVVSQEDDAAQVVASEATPAPALPKPRKPKAVKAAAAPTDAPMFNNNDAGSVIQNLANMMREAKNLLGEFPGARLGLTQGAAGLEFEAIGEAGAVQEVTDEGFVEVLNGALNQARAQFSGGGLRLDLSRNQAGNVIMRAIDAQDITRVEMEVGRL